MKLQHQGSGKKLLDKSNIIHSQSSPAKIRPTEHRAPFPQQITVRLDDWMFDSAFDSGNLAKVEKIGNEQYNLWISPDCAGTPFENQYRTWFYFKVTNLGRNSSLTMTIKNMNSQGKLFKEGMLPVYKLKGSMRWRRIHGPLNVMDNIDTGSEITFNHHLEQDDEVYFAFTYPWSYKENCEFVESLETLYKNFDNIYFHKTLLAYTKEKRKVEIMTISSRSNLEKEVLDLKSSIIFPDNGEKPQMFSRKKYVIISARVHPGEVPSSHIFNGIIKFLLNTSSLQASLLLDNFVFLMIPMLNPDGVYRGHYRTDAWGQNLNRFYLLPSVNDHPQIFAVRELFLHLHKNKRVFAYFDLHAHASKKGCFLFGNSLDYPSQVENCLLAKLISMNTEHFDYENCVFSERNMYAKDKSDGLSKEGSGRVALYKASNLTHCYTVECNYNAGRRRNYLGDKAWENAGKVSSLADRDEKFGPVDAKTIGEMLAGKFAAYDGPENSPVFDPEAFENIGEGIVLALLDYFRINPYTRIPNTPYKDMKLIRLNVAIDLLKEIPYRFDTFMRKIYKNLCCENDIYANLKALTRYIEKNVKEEEPVKKRETQKGTTKRAVSTEGQLKINPILKIININIDESKRTLTAAIKQPNKKTTKPLQNINKKPGLPALPKINDTGIKKIVFKK